MINSKVRSTDKKNSSYLQPIHQEELGGVSPTIDNIEELISSEIRSLSETISSMMQKGKISSVMGELELTTKRIQDMVWLVFIQQIFSSPGFLHPAFLMRYEGSEAPKRFVLFLIRKYISHYQQGLKFW